MQERREKRESAAAKGRKRAVKQLQIAQKSTASRGQFDEKAHKHEPKIRKKHHVEFTTARNFKEEKRRNLEILGLITKGRR